ncbi:MAG: hypothetical protein JW726_04905 [Anaerolineales bacterium]|nr:hypothetical protein [Anaerolineales bacterium]
MEKPKNSPNNPADQERIDAFCRALAQALRRIAGREQESVPDDLPKVARALPKTTEEKPDEKQKS